MPQRTVSGQRRSEARKKAWTLFLATFSQTKLVADAIETEQQILSQAISSSSQIVQICEKVIQNQGGEKGTFGKVQHILNREKVVTEIVRFISQNFQDKQLTETLVTMLRALSTMIPIDSNF